MCNKGAWWLGWIILSVITFFCAALIGLFPKYLPHKKQESNIDNYELEKMCEQSAETFDKSDNSNENVDADVNLKSQFSFNVCREIRMIVQNFSPFYFQISQKH